MTLTRDGGRRSRTVGISVGEVKRRENLAFLPALTINRSRGLLQSRIELDDASLQLDDLFAQGLGFVAQRPLGMSMTPTGNQLGAIETQSLDTVAAAALIAPRRSLARSLDGTFSHRDAVNSRPVIRRNSSANAERRARSWSR